MTGPDVAVELRDREPMSKASARKLDLWLLLGIFMCWVIVLPRLIPLRESDRGIFISVAERLLAGDTLYTSVYDNKDPFFFYLVALERSLGGWAEWGAEILMVAGCAFSTMLLSRFVADRWAAAAAGFVAVPVLLVGNFYHAGWTHLPATSLVMIATASIAYGRPALAGVAVAMAVGMKAIFLPIALAVPGVMLLLRKEWGAVARFVVAGLVTAILMLAVMIWRGEFWPFIEVTQFNIRYANGKLLFGATGLGAIVQRLQNVNDGGRLATMLYSLLAIGVLSSFASKAAAVQLYWHSTRVAFSVGLIAALVILAFTGLWGHHAQALMIPALLGLVLAAGMLDFVPDSRPTKLALLLLAALLMGASTSPKPLTESFRSARSNLASLSEFAPETQRLLKFGEQGRYARVGWADFGHAAGLKKWKLLCPRFHQYPYDSKEALDITFECLKTAPVILVSKEFPLRYNFVDETDWLAYVADVERLLRDEYTCDAPTGLRVCTRKS